MRKRRSWYSAKCIFRHGELRAEKGAQVYEERIVILRAKDEDQAMALAEKEARRYAKSLDGVEYLEFASVFHMYAAPKATAEVYSLMRESRLKPGAYLDRFFDTGTERERKVT